jgi:dienelactone hydrolase
MSPLLRHATLLAAAALIVAVADLRAQPPAPPPIAPPTDAELPDGVTAKVITFWSEGVPCYGRVFYPRGFDPGAAARTPGVVLANGWTGLAGTLERYGARFAERGLVALAIDYRGWGESGGFVTLAEPVESDDRLRRTQTTATVRIRRTRLLASKQLEDIRNAISWLQGEPGVDRDRIGLWGTSYAGGHVIAVAAMDARVKVGVAQVPAIGGRGAPEAAFALTGELRADAVRRAREGRGAEMETGFSRKLQIDAETRQAAAEYQPFHSVDEVPESVPILFVIAEKEELMSNDAHARAAAAALRGPTKVIEIPGITHFEVYRGEAFEQGAKVASDWFLEHL